MVSVRRSGSGSACNDRRVCRDGRLGHAALATLAAFALAACSRPQAPPEPVRSVRTQVVAAERVVPATEHAAEVRARVESTLSFQVPGRLTQRRVDIGTRVRAGQRLAEIDPQDLRLAQQAAAAALQAAEATAAQAAADLARFEGLHAQGFVSDAELQRHRTGARAAEAQRAQARAQAGVQGNQARYASLTAPADGVVTAVMAEPGSVLAAGSPVLRLAHAGPRDAVFAVPEDVVDAVRTLVGRAGVAQVRLWGRDEWLPAVLREVAASADPVTRAFQVKAELGAGRAELGQTAVVRLQGAPAEGVLRLPLTALREHQGGSAVWLLDDASMTVRLQPVTVAGADGNDALVAGGLAPGAEVVTAGVHLLSPDQAVTRYIEDAAPATPATPTAPRPR
jgi:membrane fusion protein, multidrug efflux system